MITLVTKTKIPMRESAANSLPVTLGQRLERVCQRTGNRFILCGWRIKHTDSTGVAPERVKLFIQPVLQNAALVGEKCRSLRPLPDLEADSGEFSDFVLFFKSGAG